MGNGGVTIMDQIMTCGNIPTFHALMPVWLVKHVFKMIKRSVCPQNGVAGEKCFLVATLLATQVCVVNI